MAGRLDGTGGAVMAAPTRDYDSLREACVENESLRRRNGALVLALVEVLSDASGLSEGGANEARALLDPPLGSVLHNRVTDTLDAASTIATADVVTEDMIDALRAAHAAMVNYWRDGADARAQVAERNAGSLAKARAARAGAA